MMLKIKTKIKEKVYKSFILLLTITNTLAPFHTTHYSLSPARL